MGAAKDRLGELKKAADKWFDREEQRLEAQHAFLKAILEKRGGAKGLQALNTEGASEILAESISDYLGKPR